MAVQGTPTAGNDVLQSDGVYATGTVGDSIFGLAGNDVLIGAQGRDTLNGGTGDDTMTGGLGGDSYIVDSSNDVVVESDTTAATGTARDIVRTTASFTLGANVEDLLAATTSNNLVLNGNTLANLISGSNGNDVLFGGNNAVDSTGAAVATQDTLAGGAGNDTYIISGVGGVGADSVTRADDIIIELENSALNGTNGGVDQVIVVASGDRRSFALNDGAFVESIIASDATSTLELNLTGNASIQTIVGNAGANILSDGGLGADTLIGLGGNDIYNVSSGLTRVNEAAGGGFDQVNILGEGALDEDGVPVNENVDGARDYDFSGQAIEVIDADNGGTGFLNITGSSISQSITGNDGSNVLIGNGGTDTLTGNDGDDTYVVDGVEDLVIENTGEGTDRVIAAGNYVLARSQPDADGNPVAIESSIELLTAAGTTLSTRTVQGDGTFNLNALSTNTALNNFLVGDSLTSQTIVGSAGNNILDGYRTNGDPLDDAALPTDGDDAPIGADTLVGLGGSDTYRVYAQDDVVVEDTSGGFDWVYTSASYSLLANDTAAATATFTDENGVVRAYGPAVDEDGNAVPGFINSPMEIEILSAANQAGTTTGINLEGNGFGQIIVGNFAANVLSDGGVQAVQGTATARAAAAGNFFGGQDQLAGLRGNDIYNVTAQSTTVNEDEGNGTDAVNVYYQTSGGTFGLIANAAVEYLTAQNAGIGVNLLGNRFNQVITGNTGADAFNGGGGQDTLVGGRGSDVYTIDATNAGNVTIIEYSSDDAAATGTTPRTLDRINTSVSFNLAQNNAAYTSFVYDGTTQTGQEVAVGAGGPATSAGNNTLISIEQIVGFGGGDINITGNGARQLIVGTTGNNVLNGDDNTTTGTGVNTQLSGTPNGDTMQGLGGNDTYRVYSQADVALEANGEGTDIVFAGGPAASGATAFSYTLYQGQHIEGLSAVNQSATAGIQLVGNELAQSAGIIGANGADTLWGREGNDVLTGRGGSDTFGFAEVGAGNADTITDFTAGDFIGLSTTAFNLGTNGQLDANEFVLGTQAADGDDRIIYNQSTGQLFYDADGNGAQASALLFATVTPGTALGFNDFVALGAPPAAAVFTGVAYDDPATLQPTATTLGA